jgi:SprB repeat
MIMKLSFLFNRLVSVGLVASLLIYAGCASNDEPNPDAVDCGTTDLAISLSTKSDPSTCGTNNGSITVSATGGATPYQFKLNSGTFGSATTFSNLGGGSFIVTVKDKNNCEKILSAVSLNAPTSPVAGASTITDHTNCLTPNGSITVNVSGGTEPYQYKIGNGAFGDLNTFSNLKAGNYTITVQDDADCSITINNRVESNTTVSFQSQVKTILELNCIKSGCHNGDNGADRNWSVFSNVKTKASNIKSRTTGGTMPPSGALPQNEIDLIACWVDSGAKDN